MMTQEFVAPLRSIVLAAVLAVSAKAATVTVTNAADLQGTCPGPNCTLRQAIATANSGDTIDFALPVNSLIELFSGELLINKSLTITGPGANILQVRRSFASGTPEFRIFNISGQISVTISGLTIYNGAADKGGGIFSSDSNPGFPKLTISNCTVSSNVADVAGGGIYSLFGTATITNCTISHNLARGSDALGGGIHAKEAFGGFAIINSTISDNRASGGGGGVSHTNVGLSGPVTFTNCTVADNESLHDNGGGVFNNGGTINVRNTIIARNVVGVTKSGTDFYGNLTSQGYNLIGNTSGTTVTGTTTGNQLNVSPALDYLASNGGPTQTIALLSGSPAVDAGDSGGVSFDGRGLARPVDSPTTPNASGGDGSDIGAYEVQPDSLPGCNTINNVVNNNNDSGSDSLRAVIANVCNGSTITFADNVRGAINLTSGQLVINKSLTINGPGANLLSVQRSAAAGTSAFRIFNIGSNINASISGLTIANGTVSGDSGGGILISGGTLNLDASTISGSSALSGGAIQNAGTLNLSNSTLSGNVAASSGGGIAGNGFTNVANSTISGNAAQGSNAGGIAVATVTLKNTTITGNSAKGNGGGIFNNGVGGATVRARNTIIALNTAANGPDVNGALISDNFNLVGNNSGSTIAPTQFSDQIGTPASPVDPLLGPLADNGGLTFTHALLSGSRAIDGGHSSGWQRDQRGFGRPAYIVAVSNAPDSDGADIGSFEMQATAATPTPSPTPGRVTTLANISTRLRVETGDNVLIGGFIVTGTQPKKVIVRGIGTSLPLADKLANPTLELHGPNGLIEANDNWIDSPNKQAIIDSTIPPGSDLESAIVATLPANNAAYTAIVRGANGSTGIGVVEAYDLDTAANSRLANISTRGFVQTGDNVLIAGTIVVGPSSQRVLIRGIGPSLPVAGKMADPFLELRDSNGAVMQSNDNWVDSPNKQAIIDTTVPPTNDLESAIIATLPGNNASYTAVLRGVNDTTGIAVVEVYALQ
jgi:hypothetical protein